ncbi:MAG: chorismate synthase, partial [Chitinophagaceae bacterium]|nr:chorismate synthase [Chitinophagaceae bacterium]
MNSFGKLFRVHIFGESHGESVGIVIDGCPAGLSLSEDDLLPDLERRKGGKQKGTTPRQEADYPIFKSGIFNGKTTGFPITILFENNNTRSEDYNKQRSIPRPGHADWVAHQKFGGHEDYRGGGHFSARLTTGLVAAGAIAKKLINHLTPNPSPKERGTELSDDFGYITDKAGNYKLLKDFAKANRKNPTQAEELLWHYVRNRNIDGYKFRRQHPIAGFIPDFVCLDAKLIVEVDGEYHSNEEQLQYDEARNQWLNEYKYRLLRFSNEEVLSDINIVIEKIRQALSEKGGQANQSEAGSPSPLERELEGEVVIAARVTEIGGEKDLEKG